MGKVTKLIGAAGILAGAAYLSKEENQKTVKRGVDKVIKKASTWTDDPYMIQLGKPDEEHDANMVDEGAMTSVLYYNELREEASKKQQ